MLSVIVIACASGTAAHAAEVPSNGSLEPAAAAGDEPSASFMHEHALTLGVISGYSIPENAMTYAVGLGLRGSVQLSHVHVGATVLLHEGDTVDIVYGGISSLGIWGGGQSYKTLPLFLLAEAGYAIEIPLGALKTELVPFFSLGTALIFMRTSGVYGDNALTDVHLAIGGGIDYRVLLNGPWSLGVDYRMYPLGDASFTFGDLSAGTIEHGYSTSVFYHALFVEGGYRF
ncbi:hypothetical protein [Sorangium sp. So ce117]|uniref:hypothetical protein n=1 Tax=Sorangium sp. So ce117 TaxID=3133277 RepID=UPI003F63CF00